MASAADKAIDAGLQCHGKKRTHFQVEAEHHWTVLTSKLCKSPRMADMNRTCALIAGWPYTS